MMIDCKACGGQHEMTIGKDGAPSLDISYIRTLPSACHFELGRQLCIEKGRWLIRTMGQKQCSK